MAKITRLGGFTDATVRGFVSPADELRARGKLGPYPSVDTDPQPAESDEADAESVTGALTGEPGTVPDGASPGDGEALVQANPSMGHQISAEGLAELVKEEESWPGNSFETSPEKPPKTDEPRKPSPRKRARSAGGPSESTEASGTAPTGTTSGPVTGA